MSVSIFGASNSMLSKGWSDIIENSFQVNKYVCGGCNSSFGLYKLIESKSIEINECAILNFGVTEDIEINEGFIDLKHLLFLMDSLYSESCNRFHSVVSLYIPRLNESFSRESSWHLHKKLAESHDALFIDGQMFVNIILQSIGYIDRKALFLDPYHLHPVIATHLGHVVKDVLNLQSLQDFKGDRDRIDVKSTSIKVLKPHSCNDGPFLRYEKISKKNFEEELAVLEVGQEVRFSGKGWLHAVYIDCSRSNAFVEIESGEKIVVKNFHCRDPAISVGSPQFKIVPLLNPIFFDNEFILRNSGTDNHITEKTRGEKYFDEEIDNSIYIAGFLVSQSYDKAEILQKDISYTNDSAGFVRDKIQLEVDGILKENAVICANTLSYLTSNAGKKYRSWVNVDRKPLDLYLRFTESVFESFGMDKDFLNIRAESMARGFNKDYIDEVSLIKNTNLFDPDFYLSTYKDVKLAGVDPVSHYCLFGYKEGRDPSREFNTNKCIQKYSLKEGENPLTYYILNVLNNSPLTKID